MKKLIFLLSFLLASILLIAGDLPKLKLHIGKKYLIETIYHEDTTETNNRRLYDKKIFEFWATGYNQAERTYNIELVLKYFMHVIQKKDIKGEWTEEEVYETGYITTFRNPIVYLNMFQIRVRFKISESNRSSSFDFSEFVKYKSKEGYELSIGEWDQKDIESEISALFFDSEKTTSFWTHKMDIRSNFRIFHENGSLSVIDVRKFSESVQKKEPVSRYDRYKRNILIDKTTGLIQEDRLSFNWNYIGETPITRYQKNISAVSEKFEVMQKTGIDLYEKAEVLNPNTSIRISVQDSTEYSRYIYLTWMDQVTNSFKSFRLAKDSIGIFNFQFNLTDPLYINIRN